MAVAGYYLHHQTSTNERINDYPVLGGLSYNDPWPLAGEGGLMTKPKRTIFVSAVCAVVFSTASLAALIEPGADCPAKPICEPTQLAACTPPCQLCNNAAATFYRDCGECINVLFCGADAFCTDDGSCRVISFTNTPVQSPSPNTPTQFPSPTATAVPCDGDLDGDRHVTIAEIVRAVSSSLNGCPD